MIDKYSREEHLQTVLKQLIYHHFYGFELEWIHVGGVTLRSKDPELWMQLMELIPEVINGKR